MEAIPGARLALVGDGPIGKHWRAILLELRLILWATCRGKNLHPRLLQQMPLYSHQEPKR